MRTRLPRFPELGAIETRDGGDDVWPGKGVVYLSRLAAKASSIRLSRGVGRPSTRT